MSIFELLSNAAGIATVLTSALAIGKRLDPWKKASHRGVSSDIRPLIVGLVVLLIPAILVSWTFSPSKPVPPIPTPTVTPLPQPTQTAQPPYLNVIGTYYGNANGYSYQVLPWTFTLAIQQQNQRSFQGWYTDIISSSDININNGTVDPNGNIQFTITESDSNGNQKTITYTSTTRSGRGWKGTWSDSNDFHGQWDAM